MGTLSESGIKLTDDEIRFLDMLSERWEKEICKVHIGLLKDLYESEKVVKEKFKNFELIPIDTLREDLIGEGKRFQNLWKLFQYVGPKSDYGEARFVMPTGTVIIIHRPGAHKHTVITFIEKEGKKWTYKEFVYERCFEKEIKHRKMLTEYTPLFSKGVKKVKGEMVPFTKEAYGGIDLFILGTVAKSEGEQNILTHIMQEYIPRTESHNYTYDHITKKIYLIDIH